MKLLEKTYFDIILLISLIFYNYLSRNWDTYHLLGLTLILLSFPFWLLARNQLGKSFSLLPKAKKLITTGLYAKFRNPIYFFSTITVLGAVLPSKSIIQYSAFFTLLIVQLLRVKKEQEILQKKFGKQYLKYKKSTWI